MNHTERQVLEYIKRKLELTNNSPGRAALASLYIDIEGGQHLAVPTKTRSGRNTLILVSDEYPHDR